MRDEMKIAHEETFGPVAGLFKFSTEEEVIARANNTDVGLAGYVYTRDIGRSTRSYETLQAGMVAINSGVVSDAASP